VAELATLPPTEARAAWKSLTPQQPVTSARTGERLEAAIGTQLMFGLRRANCSG
jgi:hypothetical protein